MATRFGVHPKTLFVALIAATLLLVVTTMLPARAANPTTMSFQGKVVNANGTNVTDGSYNFVFKLYTVSSGGVTLWTESDTLTVTAGVFQVNLGATCSFFVAAACNSSTPIDFNANPNLYLGVTFNADPAGEMSPRVQLQSVPFAFNSDKVGGLSASQLVQLSPGSQQTGNINVSGTTTSATSVITPSLTSAGALSISSGGATNVTLDTGATGGTIAIGGATATVLNLSRTGQTTTVNGALAVNQNATFNSNVIMTFGGTENLATTSDLAGTVNGISFIGTPSATAGATNGVFVQQASSANANGLDNALTIDNANSTLPIGSAINISNSGGGGFTNLISNPNFTVDGNAQIAAKGLDYFDPSKLTGVSTTVGSGGVTGSNFGGVLSTGAVIETTDSYAQEFVASLANATTNNRNVGDSGNWYFNNNAQTQTRSQDFSLNGGYFAIITNATANRGGLVAEGATPGTLDAPLNAANLPIVQMKVRAGVVQATDDVFWGMADTAIAQTVNNTLPTNGIFFWSNNSTGATGWQGVVRNAGVTVGTVNCTGGIGTNFATGRIVVVNSTTVRFFMDTDATNGVDLIDCGTVTGTLPTANLAMEMYVIHTSTTASSFDLDYARFWQDDKPPISAAQAANDVISSLTQADIATGSDTVVATPDPTAISSPDIQNTTADPVTPAPLSGLQTSPTKGGTTQLADASGTARFTFDTAGNATLARGLNIASANVSGGLTVGGDATFAGLSTFQKLATFIGKTIFRQDVQFQGHITLASDSAGYAKLLKGEAIVHVNFSTAYDTTPIVSASATDGQFVLTSVSNITPQGFDITVAVPVTADTSFTWTAVGVTNPTTSTNPVTL